jgi:hypothetical protein
MMWVTRQMKREAHGFSRMGQVIRHFIQTPQEKSGGRLVAAAAFKCGIGSFHQFFHRDEQFVNHVQVPFLKPVDHTTAQMPLQQDFADAVQGGLDGGDLIKHIVAVRIVFNHFLDAANLPFDAVQPGNQVVFDFGGMVAFASVRFGTNGMVFRFVLGFHRWFHPDHLVF